MILAHWEREWGLATRARAESRGCAMRIPNCSVHARPGSGFFQGNHGAFWHRQFDCAADLIFFPLVKYSGYEVWPLYWHPEAHEPLLKCLIDGHAFSGHGEHVFMTHVRKLASLGWECDLREGCEKYLHVDELEKIEGPPPEGVF